MSRKPRYGDVYRMPNGALWMVICRDGEPRYTFRKPEGVQNYWQLPLTDDPDEEMQALEDTATGSELGEYVRE